MNRAEKAGFQNAVKEMFTGEKINETEYRAVLRVLLRYDITSPINVGGQNVMLQVNVELQEIEAFSQKIRSGS